MVFALLVQGVGISLLLIIGLAGMAAQIIILHRKVQSVLFSQNIDIVVFLGRKEYFWKYCGC